MKMSALTMLESLGREVRRIRIEHGVTLRKMCKLLDCDVQRLSALEHGKSKDPMEFLPAFCSKDNVVKAAKFAEESYREHSRLWDEMQKILEDEA